MRSLTTLRTKLTVLLATPLAVLVAVAGLNLVHASRTAHRRADAAERVELSVAATAAASQLARERGLSASALAAGPAVPDELAFQRGQTSEAVDRLHAAIATEKAGQPSTGPALDGLRELGPAREEVDRGHATQDEVLGTYAQIIGPVLDLGPAPGSTGDPAVTRGLSAYDALARGTQEVALEQSLIRSVLDAGTIDAPTYQRLLGAVSNQGLWFDVFQRNATPAQLDRFGEVQALPSLATAQELREAALAAGPGGPVVGNAEIWSTAMGRKLDLLDALADDSAADLAGAATAGSHAAGGHRTIALLLVVAALLFAAGLIVVLHRVVGLRLQRLAGAARHAADETLPAAVETARRDGAEAARRSLRPLPRSGTDELDQIAAAVEALQVAAVGLASEGAVVRGNAHAVFLNFGTRTQDLVSQQLGHIDDLEGRTDDPDTLADLFLLDHLATRLRRNAESLVVMAGADSPRPWTRPVSVVNVVRAAAAEAADYSRVDVEPMAPAAVLGAAANDVSHLLAELLDNGLAFSPDDARVVVAGRWHHDGRYLITVSDTGRGMSAAQLAEANHRIADLPVTETDMDGYFGLFVVGRFARRHGIEVQLGPAPTAGVTAEVLLPQPLIAGPAAGSDAAGVGATAMLPAVAGDDLRGDGAPPFAPLVAVPTDADRSAGATGDRHSAPPRWLRRRTRKPAGTRDKVTPPVALNPATSPTTVGRGDD
jgi:signal transduction histidine kinase